MQTNANSVLYLCVGVLSVCMWKLVNRLLTELGSYNPPDVERSEVDSLAVSEVIEEYYQEHTSDRTRLGRLDGTYYVPSREGMEAIIEADKTDWRPYDSTVYDCENFALTFMADVQRVYGINSVGLVRDGVGGHAYNAWILMGENGLEVQLYEPQSDELVTPGQDEKHPFERASILV